MMLNPEKPIRGLESEYLRRSTTSRLNLKEAALKTSLGCLQRGGRIPTVITNSVDYTYDWEDLVPDGLRDGSQEAAPAPPPSRAVAPPPLNRAAAPPPPSRAAAPPPQPTAKTKSSAVGNQSRWVSFERLQGIPKDTRAAFVDQSMVE